MRGVEGQGGGGWTVLGSDFSFVTKKNTPGNKEAVTETKNI